MCGTARPPAGKKARLQPVANVQHVDHPMQQQSAPKKSAFATLMQGAQRAARVLQFSLHLEPGDGGAAPGSIRWRAAFSHSIGPAEAGCWSEEMTLQLGAGMSHKLRLCAPLPSSTDGARSPQPPKVIIAQDAGLSHILSLLKSALQKNCRRGRAEAAVSVAATLLTLVDEKGSRVGERELLRRLPIIFVEDALPHPTLLPVLTWMMAAHAKGFTLHAAHHALMLDAVHAVASVPWREPVHSSNGSSPAHTLLDAIGASPSAETAMVGALLIRAAFGGMRGDMSMLNDAAATWFDRLQGGHDRGRWHTSLLHAFRPTDTAKPPTTAAAAAQAAAPLLSNGDASWLQHAIPPAAVDFHISRVIEACVQHPHVVAALQEVCGAADRTQLTELCQHAMWHCSSSVSTKGDWCDGVMPPISSSPAHTATSEKRRYSDVWNAIEAHCVQFARDHVHRLVGTRSALFTAAAAAGASSLTSAEARAVSPPIIAPGLPCPCTAVAQPELDGLFLVENFITVGEEEALLRWLDRETPGWKFRDFNGPAYGMRWGVETDLKRRTVAVGSPMPPELLALTSRMRAIQGSPLFNAFEANEANALKYLKGSGHYLGAHCDNRQLSGEVLVNLSLAGDAYMTYTHDRSATVAAATHGGQPAPVRVRLPRRSLQVQSGDVRFNFRHGISNVDLLDECRVSITFRRAKLTQ